MLVLVTIYGFTFIIIKINASINSRVFFLNLIYNTINSSKINTVIRLTLGKYIIKFNFENNTDTLSIMFVIKFKTRLKNGNMNTSKLSGNTIILTNGTKNILYNGANGFV